VEEKGVSSIVIIVIVIAAMVLLLSFEAVRASATPDSEWSETFGGGDNDVAFSVIQTSDGGYALAGWTESYGAGGADLWLVKTGPPSPDGGEVPPNGGEVIYVAVGAITLGVVVLAFIFYKRSRG